MESSQPKKYQLRQASHAGSWYTDDAQALDQELNSYLEKAQKFQLDSSIHIKGIIGPHAGFSYSGPTAAWAYININPALYKRVILMGPSHHHYLDNCALSQAKQYETPLGNIEIDEELALEIHGLGNFEWMSQKVDEKEHSLEMHIPYIQKMFQGHEFKLVPIMVGNLTKAKEKEFGRKLAPYLSDSSNLFIISSDFCHWGANFDFFYHDKSDGEVWQSVEKLDKTGMKLIEDQDAQGFNKYLVETENTICGRHPIAVFINALDAYDQKTETQFVKYAQSDKAKTKKSSSVSYASSVTFVRV